MKSGNGMIPDSLKIRLIKSNKMCQSNVKGTYYLLDGNTEGILFGAEKKKKKNQ